MVLYLQQYPIPAVKHFDILYLIDINHYLILLSLFKLSHVKATYHYFL